MARTLSAGMITEVTAKSLYPLWIIKAEFDSGDLNIWTGIGPLTYNAETYTGAGNVLSISRIVEATNLEAQGAQFTLSALPAATLSLALNEDYQGRMLSCWFACMDATGALVSTPYLQYKGRMDVLDILEAGETATLTMRVENLIVDFRRVKERRYTIEDQKQDYPLDKGLQFIPQLQDMAVVWGAVEPTT